MSQNRSHKHRNKSKDSRKIDKSLNVKSDSVIGATQRNRMTAFCDITKVPIKFKDESSSRSSRRSYESVAKHKPGRKPQTSSRVSKRESKKSLSVGIIDYSKHDSGRRSKRSSTKKVNSKRIALEEQNAEQENNDNDGKEKSKHTNENNDNNNNTEPNEQLSEHAAEVLTKKLCKLHGWKLGPLLGKGGFGAVYKCTRIEPPNDVAAIKRVNAPSQNENDKLSMKRKDLLYCEIECLLRFKHPNSIQLFDFFRHKDWLFISMEFAPNGSLQNYYTKNKPFKEALTCYWIQQISRTLYAFHSTLRIAHRDMKPANILLDENYDTKLSDFGIASKCWDKERNHVILSTTFIGTRSFLSPQMLQGQPYNPFKSDVWATGVLVFQMLFNHLPFQKNADPSAILAEMEDYPAHLINMFTPNVSRDAIDVIIAMLNPEELKRSTFRRLLLLPWMIQEISRTSVLGK